MTKDRLITAAILFWVGAALNAAALVLSFGASWWLLTAVGWTFVVAGFVLSRTYYKANR